LLDFKEEIGTKAVKEAEKLAKEKAEKELEQSREGRRRKRNEASPSARQRVTREKKYYYEEDSEDEEGYLSSDSKGRGKRYEEFARRRGSAGRLRDEYLKGGYGKGAHKLGW
jgi:pyruvate/2-oxoacid:ferredoxin oxidoreductase alpha subunit